MPERLAIRVVPVDLEMRPALLRLRVLPVQRDDMGTIDSLPAGFHDSGVYHGDRSGLRHLLLRAPT